MDRIVVAGDGREVVAVYECLTCGRRLERLEAQEAGSTRSPGPEARGAARGSRAPSLMRRFCADDEREKRINAKGGATDAAANPGPKRAGGERKKALTAGCVWDTRRES